MTARLGRFALFTLISLAVAAVAAWGLGWVWRAIGGGPMSIHGWIALGLGLFGTVGLAWGLMALAFRSDRDGWDARVDNTLDPGREDDDRL